MGSRYNVLGYAMYVQSMVKSMLVLVIMLLYMSYTCLRCSHVVLSEAMD